MKKTLEHFSRTIKLYEDLLFGLNLFSDSLEAYYRGEPNIFTLNEKTFRDIKQKFDKAIVHARKLHQQIKADNARIAELAQFEFPPLSDHPLIRRIVEQAQILVDTHERMFPGRSRSNPLCHEELVFLMTEALAQFELLKTAERLSSFTKEIN